MPCYSCYDIHLPGNKLEKYQLWCLSMFSLSHSQLWIGWLLGSSRQCLLQTCVSAYLVASNFVICEARKAWYLLQWIQPNNTNTQSNPSLGMSYMYFLRTAAVFIVITKCVMVLAALIDDGFVGSLVTRGCASCNGWILCCRKCLWRCVGSWSLYSPVQLFQG